MNKYKNMNIYWANLCILNRIEADEMEKAAESWKKDKNIEPRMIYLGDTEEIQMYEKLDKDLAAGKVGFDLIVSSRFDVFCSQKYLQGCKEQLFPIRNYFDVKVDLKGIQDPEGLFHPLVVLPHYILVNANLVRNEDAPQSLEELLDPVWKGKVYVGSTDLPSGKSVLFNIWYLYGKEGLEACVKNWKQKSAPSAARFGSVKGECPVSILPGVFTGPGPQDNLRAVCPREGAPLLPSYAAIRESDIAQNVVDFLAQSAASIPFTTLYRERAFAYPTHPRVSPPEGSGNKMFFPPWEWIKEQDMEYFEEACKRMS